MEYNVLLKFVVSLVCIVLVVGFENEVKSSQQETEYLLQKVNQAPSGANTKNVSSEHSSLIFGQHQLGSGQQQVTTRRVPPTTGRRQTTTHRQITTRRNQPTTGRRQPTTGRNQPTTGRRLPTTGRNQPTTGRRQPTTGRNQPTTGRRQPTTGRNQPTTGRRQPTTGNKCGLLCDQNKTCIHDGNICDRIRDCNDGADESCLKSESKKCNVGEFLCPSGTCVLKSKINPLDKECWLFNSSTPEELEKYCTYPLFLCDHNKRCISTIDRCDGIFNCKDKTDEMDPKKHIQHKRSFSCANNYCISNENVCNGVDDCGDGSDEFPYSGCPVYPKSCDSFSFGVTLYRCSNGLCINKLQVNDSHNDCGDYSDEFVKTLFLCDNGQYINNNKVCNGLDDCGDDSDETSCPVSCSEHTCSNDNCILTYQVCNGVNDCGDNSDETSCPVSCSEHTCSNDQCIDSDQVCNGVDDCGDDSDEEYCSSDAWLWSDNQPIIISTSIVGGMGLIIMCIAIFAIMQRKKRTALAQAAARASNQPPRYSEVINSYPLVNETKSQNVEQGYTNPLYADARILPQ